MPVIKIQSNCAPEADQGEAFLKKVSDETSQILGKPESYVMVILEPLETMLFSGNSNPLAYIELKSIGLPTERTKEISAALCELLDRELDIPQNRIYIEFTDATRNMFGWNGSTFER